MKWEKVRKLYPDQYVRLNIINFYVEDDKKIVIEVAIINIIESPETATKELLRSKDNTIVYHTGTEEIIIEMRKSRIK